MDIEKRRAALIDMDGVLYDSMKYHTLAWRQMMGEYGLDIPRDEFYLYEGMTGAATIDLIWEREFGKRCDPGQIERMYHRKTEIFKELGRKERMAGARDVTHGKPSPEPYLKGASLAGVAPERCIVVENAPLGVRAGKAAGCLTVAVTTGPIPREAFEKEGADFIFRSMGEFADALPGLIQSIEAESK